MSSASSRRSFSSTHRLTLTSLFPISSLISLLPPTSRERAKQYRKVLSADLDANPPCYKALVQLKNTAQHTGVLPMAVGNSLGTKHEAEVNIRSAAEHAGYFICMSRFGKKQIAKMKADGVQYTNVQGVSTPGRLAFRCVVPTCPHNIVVVPKITESGDGDILELGEYSDSNDSNDSDESSSDKAEEDPTPMNVKVDWIVKKNIAHNHSKSAANPGNAKKTNYTVTQLAWHVVLTGGDHVTELKPTAIVALLNTFTYHSLKTRRSTLTRIGTQVKEIVRGKVQDNYRLLASLAARCNGMGHSVRIYHSSPSAALEIAKAHLKLEYKYEFKNIAPGMEEYVTFTDWSNPSLKGLQASLDKLDAGSKIYRGITIIPKSAIAQWSKVANYSCLDGGHMQGGLGGIMYALTGSDADRKNIHLALAHFTDNENAETAELVLKHAADTFKDFLTDDAAAKGVTVIDGGKGLVSACSTVFKGDDGAPARRDMFLGWRHRRVRAGMKSRTRAQYDALVFARNEAEAQAAYDAASDDMKKFMDKFKHSQQSMVLASPLLDGRGTQGICESEMAASLKAQQIRLADDPFQFLLRVLDSDRERAIKREKNARWSGDSQEANSSTKARLAKAVDRGANLTVNMDALGTAGSVQMLSQPARKVSITLPLLSRVAVAAGGSAAAGGAAEDVKGSCSCNTSKVSKDPCVHLLRAAKAAGYNWHKLLPNRRSRGFLKEQYAGMNFNTTYPIVATGGLTKDAGGVRLFAPMGLRVRAGRPKGKQRKKGYSEWMKKYSAMGPTVDSCRQCGNAHGREVCRV